MDYGSYLYIPWSVSTSKDWSSSGLPLVLARPGRMTVFQVCCFIFAEFLLAARQGGCHYEHRRNIHHHWRCGIWFSAKALQISREKYSNINKLNRPTIGLQLFMFDLFVREQGSSKGRTRPIEPNTCYRFDQQSVLVTKNNKKLKIESVRDSTPKNCNLKIALCCQMRWSTADGTSNLARRIMHLELEVVQALALFYIFLLWKGKFYRVLSLLRWLCCFGEKHTQLVEWETRGVQVCTRKANKIWSAESHLYVGRLRGNKGRS